MSVFRTELEKYLKLRHGDLTPESFSVTSNILFNFDSFLDGKEYLEKNIPEKLINEWIATTRLTHAQRTTSDWVSHLRGFLRFLRYEGYEVFLPHRPKTPDKYIPYIFSDDEVKMIFEAADNLKSKHRNSENQYICLEFSMLLRLLYGCGLRLGEALLLRMENVNLLRGTLYLRETKNDKQRIVPMEQSLVDMLQKYCCAMKLIDRPDALLFPGRSLEFPMSRSTAKYLFHRILNETGIYIRPEPHTRGQCLHCFRHLFAIKSFAQAERLGYSTDDSVPYLSAYLGHRDLDETEKYLKFSSDIFPEYADIFEKYALDVFAEVSL